MVYKGRQPRAFLTVGACPLLGGGIGMVRAGLQAPTTASAPQIPTVINAYSLDNYLTSTPHRNGQTAINPPAHILEITVHTGRMRSSSPDDSHLLRMPNEILRLCFEQVALLDRELAIGTCLGYRESYSRLRMPN